MKKRKHNLIKVFAAALTGFCLSIIPVYAAVSFKITAKRRGRKKAAEPSSVCITAFDGLKLFARVREAPDPKRIIVAMHGWHSSPERDFGKAADFLASCGCTVIYPHQRCHGMSEGGAITFGICESRDVISWLEFVKQSFPENLPVYLYGVSMGASSVLMTEGRNYPIPVSGIIADCGYSSPFEVIHRAAKRKRLPPGVTAGSVQRQLFRKTGHRLSDIYVPDILKNAEVPVLFIHGTADALVPFYMALENFAACTAPKKLITFFGTGHAKSYTEHPNEYESALTSFFQKYDGK